MPDPIHAAARPDGTAYWWFRVSAGRHPVTGRRVQVYRSGSTRREVRAEYARIVHEIAERRYVARDGITVSAYLDRWAPVHGRDLEDGSRAQLRHALARVRGRLGGRKLQSVTRADVDALVDWMLTSGRRRGGKPGTGLSPRTVQLTLTAFSRACDDAIEDRLVTVNPCRRVKRPRQVRPVHDLWSDAETAGFEKAAAPDRLWPVVVLQCLGLRPEEACGLRWRDIDLAARTLRVRVVRTLVDGRPAEKPPKTDAGKRTLPLDGALAALLRAFRAVQAAERLAAGPAYSDGGYVACDELGAPSDPARLRRAWYRLMRRAGVRKVRPYTASRHAAGSYLSHAGVSPDIIAAWLGHADASFTMRTYVHARPEDLAAARDALARKISGE